MISQSAIQSRWNWWSHGVLQDDCATRSPSWKGSRQMTHASCCRCAMQLAGKVCFTRAPHEDEVDSISRHLENAEEWPACWACKSTSRVDSFCWATTDQTWNGRQYLSIWARSDDYSGQDILNLTFTTKHSLIFVALTSCWGCCTAAASLENSPVRATKQKIMSKQIMRQIRGSVMKEIFTCSSQV
jgi:hypothetical protein